MNVNIITGGQNSAPGSLVDGDFRRVVARIEAIAQQYPRAAAYRPADIL